MSKRILYNFASRSRPSKFFEVLDNIREFSNSDDYIVLAKIDSDDSTMLVSDVHDLMTGYPELQVKWGISESKIHAINRNLNNLPNFDILVNISDDILFTQKGFDDLIREYCKPDTFVHFPESYKKAACSVLSIMHRDYFYRTGHIYNPAYYSLWSDIEATEVAKLLGCYVYVPKTIFKHVHYSTAGIPKDMLYVRNNTYKKDRLVYLQRRERNFDLPAPKTPYVLIKYATRGRWRLFFQSIDNIYATIRTNQFKIVVSADFDDVEMNSAEVREWVKRYPNVELHYGNHQSKVEAINADFNPATNWHWCVNHSDDMTYNVFGWDNKMLEDVRTIWPEGWDWFAHFNDGFVGDKLPTLNVCGRQYYERTGNIYDPSYKSVSCDAENMFRAMMLGRYHYFPQQYFSHDHPANKKEPSDHIYRRNHVHGEGDTKVYFERMKTMFGIANPVMIPEQMKPYL